MTFRHRFRTKAEAGALLSPIMVIGAGAAGALGSERLETPPTRRALTRLPVGRLAPTSGVNLEPIGPRIVYDEARRVTPATTRA